MPRGPLDNRRLHAYTFNMSTEKHKLPSTPCLCNALRQASRAVSRLYDEELRSVGLRTTQYSLLGHLSRAGEVRQRDLGGLTSLDETTLTRNLRPLIDSGWVAIGTGKDRREKLVRLTEVSVALRHESRIARWPRARARQGDRGMRIRAMVEAPLRKVQKAPRNQASTWLRDLTVGSRTSLGSRFIASSLWDSTRAFSP